jgi:hypothetical protein
MAAITRERPALPVNGNVMATSETQGMAPRHLAGLVGAPAGGRLSSTPGPTLLVTKLAIPTPSPSLVARPRLTARLQAAATGSGPSACRLALVVAPAGSGKSSVVSQWCQEHDTSRIAGLSLDSHDNEPIRFLRYLGAALATVAPGATDAARVLLQSPQPPSLHHRKAMSRTC